MFARYLDAHRRRPWQLYAAFVGSMLLEAGLVTFLLIHAMLHVPEVDPPPLWVRLSRFVPPQSEASPAPRRAPAERAPRGVKKRSDVVQPRPDAPATPPDPGKDGTPDGDPDAPEGPDTEGPPGQGPDMGGGSPREPAERYRLVPALRVRADRLSGDLPHLPDVVRAQRRGSTVIGSYKLCIGRDGVVTVAEPVSGIPGADEAVLASLRGWRYKEQPIPVCFIEAFQFVVE